MVTTIDVREFIVTDNYLSLMNKTINTLSLTLRDGNIPIQIFNIDANSINKSGISLDELNELCRTDIDKIVHFIKLHQNEITGEDEDEENDSVTLEVLPPYSNFLIGYLIKYFFLKNKPKALEIYLKALRIPDYKKHAVELKDIYNRL